MDMPGTLQGPKESGMKKTDNSPCPHGVSTLVREDRQVKYIACVKEKKEGEDGGKAPGWGRGTRDKGKRSLFKQGRLKKASLRDGI